MGTDYVPSPVASELRTDAIGPRFVRGADIIPPREVKLVGKCAFKGQFRDFPGGTRQRDGESNNQTAIRINDQVEHRPANEPDRLLAAAEVDVRYRSVNLIDSPW